MHNEAGALQRAAALLAVLAEAREPLGAAEAGRLAKVARNTAYRSLKTLTAMGWVIAVGEPQRYRLSAEPGRMFGMPWHHSSITEAAHPALRRLATATGETVYLAVRDGERSVNVQVIEGRGLLRVAGALGQGFPLHASAPGKIFLAFEPGLLDRIARRALPRISDATITSADRLRSEIRNVRRQGFALNREELARGLVGLAVPVLDAASACAAALGVLVPVASCRAQDLEQRFAAALTQAAGSISRALGRR